MALQNEAELAKLWLLSKQFPNVDSALAQVAALAAELTLPKRTIHVLSDVHGEHAKLRHVINNASGSLRPLVEKMFLHKLPPDEFRQLLTLIFYPRETLERLMPTLATAEQKRDFAIRALNRLLALIRVLAKRHSLADVERLLPEPQKPLLLELLHIGEGSWNEDSEYAVLDVLARHDRNLQILYLAAKLLQHLAIDELVVAGDFWDRGPRGDRVMDYIMEQPEVAITWGNHDVAWLGAALGQEALIAHVLRISLRYRRLSQLEEGYGITMQPLEWLARTVYERDPASTFPVKGTGLRETEQMARMQKAAAIMQFKLEGQLIDRNPDFNLAHRKLLHRINHAAGTIDIGGVTYRLRDCHFPTIDPERPYELSPEERACMDRTRQSFLSSQKLRDHMRYLVDRGSMWLVRDDHLIFHGCVPVDEQGEFLPFPVDGREVQGKALFDAIDAIVAGILENPTDKAKDLMWYLWCGPRSPLFGKDKIATFEIDLVADESTHVETKNPYFRLIHDARFCERILAEFGADPKRGLIVNGHVPVKIDAGEDPLKRSGKAITIDGAFSEAYGDHGYTLVLEPERTYLAKHHHFESVEAAVRDGVDIIPETREICRWQPPRRVADTERGRKIRAQIELLESLIDAYRHNVIRQRK
ncbi:MAG: fructose-1,6-bisphosphatase class 3 [Gemmatales bacterium]|nr:MAG: fructose-1,6-bisphosphatase class 3 [Gemmatales bacterium]